MILRKKNKVEDATLPDFKIYPSRPLVSVGMWFKGGCCWGKPQMLGVHRVLQ
jgi:hypothetical protein